MRRNAEEAEQMLANYFTSVVQGDDKLNIFNESVEMLGTRWVTVSNLTADQRDNLADLRREYENTEDKIASLSGGVAALGMTEDERNEALAEQTAHLQAVSAAMQPYLAIQDDVVQATTEATINTTALNEEMFQSAQDAGASAFELALLGGALGIYSEEAVNAALKSALINEEIDRLARMYAEGKISVEDMRESVLTFAENIDNELAAAIDDSKIKLRGSKEAFEKSGLAAATAKGDVEDLTEELEGIPTTVTTKFSESGLDSMYRRARELRELLRQIGQGGGGGSGGSGGSTGGNKDKGEPPGGSAPPPPPAPPLPPPGGGGPVPQGAQFVRPSAAGQGVNEGGQTVFQPGSVVVYTLPGQSAQQVATSVVQMIGDRTK